MPKKIAALLMLLLVIAGLTACSTQLELSAPEPAATEAATQAPTTQLSARYTEDGRRIITLGTWYDRYYFSKHTDIHDDPKLAAEDTAQMRLDRMREVEAKYNVVLEYVNLTFDGIQESMRSSIPEGKPDVEIYEVDVQFGIPAVLSGYAVSLESMELLGSDVFEGQNVLKSLELLGQEEHYLFGPSSSGSVNAYPLAFNLTMLKQAGLENPQDLYDRGEWTWEKWREYLKALTVDENGDGVPEIYGYSGYWTHLLGNLLKSNGTGIAAGEVQTLSSPETLEVLQFIQALYQEDKTARPWDSSNWNINNDLYAAGLTGFWIGADWLFGEQGGVDLDFEIGVVPWPCGPSGNMETNRHSQPATNWYFIPKGVEDPRFVYDVLFDWLNWYDGDLSVGQDLEWSRSMYMNDRNFSYAQLMDARPGFDLWENLGVNMDVSALLLGEITPEALVEANQQAYQDALDQYFQ